MTKKLYVAIREDGEIVIIKATTEERAVNKIRKYFGYKDKDDNPRDSWQFKKANLI